VLPASCFVPRSRSDVLPASCFVPRSRSDVLPASFLAVAVTRLEFIRVEDSSLLIQLRIKEITIWH
jgi:hypothetical protein